VDRKYANGFQEENVGLNMRYISFALKTRD